MCGPSIILAVCHVSLPLCHIPLFSTVQAAKCAQSSAAHAWFIIFTVDIESLLEFGQ